VKNSTKMTILSRVIDLSLLGPDIWLVSLIEVPSKKTDHSNSW